MTDSKSPSSNRIQRPSILATSAVLGHSYSGNQFQAPLRHKISQALQPSAPAANTSSAANASGGVTQFHVTVPLGLPRDQLSAATSFPPKSNPSLPPTIKAYPSIDKIPITLSPVNDVRVKANVKNAEPQSVNYVKQMPIVGPSIKSLVTSSSLVQPQATIKKDADIGKARPVLLGQGLRQIPKANLVIDPHRIIPRSTSSHVPMWTASHSDTLKTQSTIPVVRSKGSFQNATVTISAPHDLSKKPVVQQHPKSTISISAATHMPYRDSGHRPPGFTVASFTSNNVNKPIYQVLQPDLQTQVPGNPIKKISAMIVCQPSSLSVTNVINTSAGFASSNVSLSSGHNITIVTSSDSITYSSSNNPPNGTSITTIPVAKVYPQQQVPAASRLSLSSAPSRLSVPLMSSIGGAASRSNPALIQVGPIRSTSSNMTSQSTIMSTIPVAVSSKSPANSGSIVCWSTYSQTFALSTVTNTSSSRPNLAHTNVHSQSLPISGSTIRVQPQNVLLVEPKISHLQAPVGNAAQAALSDNRSNSVPHSPSQSGVGGTTPTQSPKPAILRRQRPENSNALKKLTFSNPSVSTQRRDLPNKPTDRRYMPYPPSRSKMTNSTSETKLDVPIIHSDKNEIRPVMENQLFVKQHIPGINAPLKIIGNPNSKGLASPSSNSAKDSGTHSYSIHAVMDSKIKMEVLPSQKTSIKSEPASASQMLQLQNQSMHTYAAESPPASNIQHKAISQESGHHVTTNTIFTKPLYPSQHSARTKPAPVMKVAGQNEAKIGNHSINSFTTRISYPVERGMTQHDYVKKEPPRLKPVPGIEMKHLPDTGRGLHHTLPNHILPTSIKSWTSSNNCDPLAGLSPRKRPRKQTHVVSEDQPVVMEDEESTDDADECEDEPMVRQAAAQLSNSTTSVAFAPKSQEAKAPVTSKQIKSEPVGKKGHADEGRNKVKAIKSEPMPISSDMKPQSEYMDRNGVRYVVSRKRPSVSVLNKGKQSTRSVSNHFMHYSDVRAKDKKTTIADLASHRKRLKGFNIARFALQLQDMVECEKNVWDRMNAVFDGLVKYKATHLSDSSFDSFAYPLSPATPSSLSSSFRKATPRTSSSCIVENGLTQSPLTPLDRKTNKLKDDILNIEELAQANLQRCRVVCDQLTDTKSTLLKAIDHRQLVTDILDSTNNQKTTSSSNSSATQNSSKRLKKKNAS